MKVILNSQKSMRKLLLAVIFSIVSVLTFNLISNYTFADETGGTVALPPGKQGLYMRSLFLAAHDCYVNEFKSSAETINLGTSYSQNYKTISSSRDAEESGLFNSTRKHITTAIYNSADYSTLYCAQVFNGYKSDEYSGTHNDTAGGSNAAKGLLELYNKGPIFHALNSSDLELMGYIPDEGSTASGKNIEQDITIGFVGNNNTTVKLSVSFDTDGTLTNVEIVNPGENQFVKHYPNYNPSGGCGNKYYSSAGYTITIAGRTFFLAEKWGSFWRTQTYSQKEYGFYYLMPDQFVEGTAGSGGASLCFGTGNSNEGQSGFYELGKISGRNNNGFVLTPRSGDDLIDTGSGKMSVTAGTATSSETGAASKYKIGDKEEAFWRFVEKLTSQTNLNHDLSQFAFTAEDKAALYIAYIDQLLDLNKDDTIESHPNGVRFKWDDNNTCYDELPGEAERGGNYFSVNEGKWCMVVNVKKDAARVYYNRASSNNGYIKVVSDDGKSLMDTSGKDDDAVREILRRLMELAGQFDLQQAEGQADTDTTACLRNNSAGSLSWAVCPAIEGAAEGTDGLYGLIKDELEFDPAYLDRDARYNGTFQAWQYFQGFANVIAIIFLLFIIFSQVTGFGINNYGVKKALPKLLIMVILINLSFLICQIAVDISNIIGNNLSLLMSSIANTITYDIQGNAHIGDGGAVAADAVVGGAGLLAYLMPIVLQTVGFTGWIGVILLAVIALVAGIAALVIYVMLAIRIIVIVVAVAIAPLAFACNIFPGTEPLFKKWLEIMKSMLLMYPLCSALYGAGCLGRAIIWTTNGGHLSVIMGMVCAMLPMLPYFALPSLLRGSLKAVGNIGGIISGMGRTLRHSAQAGVMGAARNSRRVQDANRQSQLRRSERLVNRLNERENSGRNLSNYQKRRRAAAMGFLDRESKMDQQAAVMNTDINAMRERNANLASERQFSEDVSAEEYDILQQDYGADIGGLRDHLQETLESDTSGMSDAELYKHKTHIAALQNRLLTFGGKGRREMAAAYNGAIDNTVTPGGTGKMSEASAGAYNSNLVRKHGELAKSMVGTMDTASRNMNLGDKTKMVTADHKTTSARSLGTVAGRLTSATDLASIDKSELREVVSQGYIRDGAAGTTDYDNQIETAREVLRLVQSGDSSIDIAGFDAQKQEDIVKIANMITSQEAGAGVVRDAAGHRSDGDHYTWPTADTLSVPH